MKWQLVLVCAIAGILLAGCGDQKPDNPNVGGAEEATTPAQGLAAANQAYAAAEKAFEGGNAETIGTALLDLDRKVGALAGAVSEVDTKAAEDARQAGNPEPAKLMSALQPAMVACGEAVAAIAPPNNDVAAAKAQMPAIKAALDALQGKL
jgi:hypothetical protein